MIRHPAALRRRLSLVMLLSAALLQAPARAATYFVDTEIGNDAWSGRATTAAVAPATDGPWRTLARVASANLQPGDAVRLRCAQRWNETLRLTRSGTSGNPLVIGAYPQPCATLPAIDGRVTIPADNWVLEHGRVYRATLPINLVQNGALDRSTARWSQPAAPRGKLAFKRGCVKPSGGCLRFTTPAKGKGLLASARFALERGRRYRASYRIFVPKGVTATARIRRSNARTPTLLAAPLRVVGTGKWQTRSFNFVARGSASDARLDFEVPAPRKGVATTRLRKVAIKPYLAPPVFLMMGGRLLQPAHHPNFGHDAQAPGSVYLLNAQDSDTDAGTHGGSSFVTTGEDLLLPAGATIEPGMTIRVRSENWVLDEGTVTGVDGERLAFTPATSYPVKQGWGYFLLGAKWMVDSPDEWYYDAATQTVTLWMPDGAPPGNRVRLSNVVNGIDLAGVRNVVVENIAVRGVITGVVLNNARDVVVRGMTIEDTRARGIDMAFAQRVTVELSTFRRIGKDAISACVRRASGCGSHNVARDNRIEDNGLLEVGARMVNIPAPVDAAIALGPNATVSGNRVLRSGGLGILMRHTSVVSNNAITDACMVLDDCGGIYANGHANNSQIVGNLIKRVRGNTLGTTNAFTRGVGIYLDEQAEDILVANNVTIEADHGIQLHNAHGNTVHGNILYGHRRNQLFVQEHTNVSRGNGDIHDNVISDNVLVPTADLAALQLQTAWYDVHDFASFSGNVYSTLLGAKVALEVTPDTQRFYTMAEWQSATAAGAPRHLDATGREVRLQGFAALRMTGADQMPNGALAAGLDGWSKYSAEAPAPELTLEACPGPCLRLLAGGSSSLISSPNFSVTAGQRYRVSFDAATSAEGEVFTVVPRRGGGGTAGYEPIGAGQRSFAGTVAMQRYSFVFRASMSVTVNDPLTGERGARIDFQGILPGRALRLANVEIVPVGFQDVTLKTAVLANDDPSVARDFACPDAATIPANCSAYVDFLDASPVSFPYTLAALEAKVLYTRDPALVDADSDGVPDTQDSCPATAPDLVVNAVGCDITQ